MKCLYCFGFIDGKLFELQIVFNLCNLNLLHIEKENYCAGTCFLFADPLCNLRFKYFNSQKNYFYSKFTKKTSYFPINFS
jgi:hypothetical protein